MKKLIFLFICIILFFASCQKEVFEIDEKIEDFGSIFEWSLIDTRNNLIKYTFIVQNNGSNTLFISTYFPKTKSKNLEEKHNVKMGSIERRNGKIYSISIEATKYIIVN
jgi:hypothetical protein